MDNDRKVLESGEAAEMEERLSSANGTVRYWQTRKVPLRDAQGVLIGLLGIGRDIMQRKLAERQRDADRLSWRWASRLPAW